MIVSIILLITLVIMLAYSLVMLSQYNFLLISIFSLICISAIFCVIFPEKTTIFVNFLGVGRGADLFLYFCFISGCIAILLIHLQLRRQHYLITKIVRYIAISRTTKARYREGRISDVDI